MAKKGARSRTSGGTTALNVVQQSVIEHRRELSWGAVSVMSLFAMVSLASFHPDDPTWLRPVLGVVPIHNRCGSLGANVADLLSRVAGVGAWALVVTGVVVPIFQLARRPLLKAYQWALALWSWAMGLALIQLALGAEVKVLYPPGGAVGVALGDAVADVVGVVGAWILIGASLVGSLSVLFGISWGVMALALLDRLEAGLPQLPRGDRPVMERVGALMGALLAAGSRGAWWLVVQVATGTWNALDRLGAATRRVSWRLACAAWDAAKAVGRWLRQAMRDARAMTRRTWTALADLPVEDDGEDEEVDRSLVGSGPLLDDPVEDLLDTPLPSAVSVVGSGIGAHAGARPAPPREPDVAALRVAPPPSPRPPPSPSVEQTEVAPDARAGAAFGVRRAASVPGGLGAPRRGGVEAPAPTVPRDGPTVVAPAGRVAEVMVTPTRGSGVHVELPRPNGAAGPEVGLERHPRRGGVAWSAAPDDVPTQGAAPDVLQVAPAARDPRPSAPTPAQVRAAPASPSRLAPAAGAAGQALTPGPAREPAPTSGVDRSSTAWVEEIEDWEDEAAEAGPTEPPTARTEAAAPPRSAPRRPVTIDEEDDASEDSDSLVGRAVRPMSMGEVEAFEEDGQLAIGAAEGLGMSVKDDGGAVADRSNLYFELPHLSLLDPVPEQRATIDEAELRDLASTVEASLASFKVTGKVTNVRVGPVVTTFEFLPDQGISVRRIAALQDDLAMALCAVSVRVVAPIPGKGVVGIEIPSTTRMTIYLRELLASDEFRKSTAELPVILGKDVEGRPMVGDLARMPHVLIGGTTGSGKSVGVNGMLMSLLFTRTPEELRMLLVDPKKLEFESYADIPHLLHPVVTEAKGAAAALAWACREMDRRYELLARWATRNITNYNKKVEREARQWTREKARRYAPKDWPEDVPPPQPEVLPYIVIVIDELADLMMVAKKEVQDSIVRLAQMARACGMHLMIATQRPSVDVVTGIIKSNLPTRISFKLRSVIDSRTILDQGGAEKLLGQGDMLYLPGAGDVKRAHGPFVSDDEVNRVMDFLRAQREPDYIETITADPDAAGAAMDDADPAEQDDLFNEAVDIVLKAGKASTSMIQRHLKIGYNRAARIIDLMEQAGIVGPADGARPREVLIGPNAGS